MARRSSGAATRPISDVVLVATGKSRAEISALRHLREAYEALGTRVPETASPAGQEKPGFPSARSPARSIEHPLSSRGRVLDTVRALQQSIASPPHHQDLFAHWLVLEALAQAIEVDATALQREIQASEVRTNSTLQLPPEGLDTLDAKLLVLSEVLGHEAFASYSRDLFRELATLRQRCSLYGDALKQFQEHVQLQCIGSHRMRDVLGLYEWLEIANASLGALQLDHGEPMLVSHFPVLMQHCSPPRSMDGDTSSVAVVELLQLLEQLPPARERLVSLCFEQIGDVRRGSGFKPPPEGIRPHKLMALVKQSHAETLCSQDDRDRIVEWLDQQGVGDEATVSRSAFLQFHVTVSDRFANEDAEFVAFLMRVWQFEMPKNLGVHEVVADCEARCHELTTMARKCELLKKLDNLRLGFPSRLASLRLLVGQVDSVSIQNAEQLQRLILHQQLTSLTLLGLRVLRLQGLSLREFPVFVVALPLLEELHLSDNQLRDALPLVTIGGMKTLKKLVLSDNFLTDKSFSDPDFSVWEGLSSLTTLELSRNQLTAIPAVVVSLKNLHHLGLAANKLRDRAVAADVASHWQERGSPRLQTLNVRDNELSTLPDVVFTTGQKSLQVLYAQDNHLTDVPTSFGLLESLHEAVFSRNRLKQIGPNDLTPLLARCGAFQALTLDHNQLKLFPAQSPASPTCIRGIQAIHCAKNRLRILPPLANFTFQACEELDLRGNALTEILDAFFPAFPILKRCHLQQNVIQRLPDSIAQCMCLEILEVYENKLESVPDSLSTLTKLAVLNVRENQITKIPSAWHAFAHHSQQAPGKLRVLQTLNLQRNPLRNKVLQTLVDGSMGMGASSMASFKSSATQICELYVRKLIDALQLSVPVLRLAHAAHTEHQQEEQLDESEDEDGTSRRGRRWKGRARFVVQHLEAQLRAKGESVEGGRRTLWLPRTAFEKLLKKIQATTTKKELRLMSERFLSHGSQERVDGLSFLCGVEAVGLINTLSAGGAEARTDLPARCESVRKPVDGVASILQYLQVAHERTHKVRPSSIQDPSLESVKSQAEPATGPGSARAASKAAAARSRRRQSAKSPRDTPAAKPLGKVLPRGRDNLTEVHPHVGRTLSRQQQRICVLEQQLLDQRLLRLAEQNAQRAVAKTPLLVDAPAAESAAASSVLVHVRLLNQDDVPTQHGDPIVVAVARDATVLHLKQAIATRVGIDVARQVLVAKTTQSAGGHERLRDDLCLAPFFQHPPARSQGRWQVSLIVSDPFHVNWSKLRTPPTRKDLETHSGSEERSTKYLSRA